MDRRTAPDRRTPDRQSGDTGQRRRSSDSPSADAGAEQDYSGLERRRGPGRRLSDMRKSAEQGEMTKEQFLFLMAIDSFKKANDLAFPTWTDVLEVVRLLGYRKVRKSELNLQNAEDWSESFDAPSNVRPERWRAWKRIDRDRTDRKAA
jgi:hypothetical protein